MAALVLIARPASAQAPDPYAARLAEASGLVHEVWTIQDDLPLSHLNGVIQAGDGYLWLSSFDGLIRFDGARFTVFNTATNPELPTNRFTSIIEGPDGSVWAAAEFDYVVKRANGAFEVYGLGEERRGTAVDGLQFDSAGTLWVRTNRGVYVMRGGRLQRLGDDAPRQAVSALFLQADGSVWIGTDGWGAFRWQNGKVHQVVDRTASARSRLASSFAETADGTVYIGTGAGILAYRDGSVTRVGPPRFAELFVFSLVPLGDDSVLVVSDRGLFTLDAGVIRERRPEIRGRRARPISLLDGPQGDRWLAVDDRLYRNEELVFEGRFPIAAIAFDHEGSLWIAADGLHRLKPALFRVYGANEGALDNIYPILEDSRGRIWLGSLAGGIAIYEKGRFRILGSGVPSLPQAIFEDRAGRIWIGGLNYGGCVLEGLTCAQPIPFLAGHTVKAIYQDRSGAMWFGTDRGLYRDSAGVRQHFTSENGLPHDFVRVIHEARDGSLWFGTNGGGLARYRDGRFESLTAADGLSSDLVRSIHEDEAGVLWIGTEDAGLNRVQFPEGGSGAAPKPAQAKITVIRRRDGLYDDGVHAILDDGRGRYWMSSNRGIFWVLRSDLEDFAAGRTSTIHSISYTERDGLRNREANGGVGSPAIVASDGRLWFATQAGAAVVDPAATRPSDAPIPIRIEEVRSEGARAMLVGQEGRRRLKLEARQRDFEIAYTALSFLAPDNLRFQYRLDGFQDAWVEAGNRRTAFFTNVPPGSYTFRVRATRGDGTWHEVDSALSLTVSPYFYETAWFKAAFAIALILLGLAWLRARESGHRRRSRQLERRVAERTATIEAQAEQLKELDAAKSRFFTNISHEFRTPLTLMIGPLEDLRAGLHGAVAPEADREISLALRNARRLLKLVDQLLDVARLEADRIELQVRQGDIVALIRELLLSFSPMAERKRVTVRFDAPSEPCEAYFDPDLLEKVFANLVGNALKYTPEGGVIRVSLRTTVPVTGHPDFADMPEGYVTVQVKDSGPGIAPEDLPHVFDRFYRAETANESQGGTGLGLSLARDLVALHGGRIEVESEEGFGATFTVTLPLGEAHFDAAPLAEGATADRARELGSSEELEAAGEPPHDEEVATGHPAETTEVETDSPTVLLIDDNADLRAYLARHLRSASYRAVEAGTGGEGLRLARELVPDCIISDIMMPGLDGHALCRSLKSDPELDFVPVILLTAKAGREHKLEGLAEGADDYLTKPFDVDEVVARVGNLIGSRQRLRDRFQRRAEIRPEPVDVLSRDEAFLERVRQALEAHLTDSDFSVERFAEVVSQSRSQLYRRLHDLTGQSPSEVIQNFRLERAADLLAARAGTVSEIAYGVGFKSVSHFCRRFQARYGVSPSAHARAPRTNVPGS
jgi:signal transduction histidine kinase/DNA-binding response OmpR family regulator/streptogramin lyase